MASATFIPSFNLEDKLTQEFLASDGARRVCEAIAEVARDVHAPVDTGEYRDSIHVADGKVVADAPHAVVVEFGTNDTPAFAPLRKAAETVLGTSALRKR